MTWYRPIDLDQEKKDLMSIEVDDHGFLDPTISKHVANSKCDVCIDAETASRVGWTVVESPTDVDRPAPVQR